MKARHGDRWRVALWAVLVVGLLVSVLPIRTFLVQRSRTAAAEEQLSVLTEQNGVLDERVARLRDDAEIERLARREFGLVRPGEEAVVEVPPSTTTTVAGERGDGDGVRRGALETIWDGITGIF
ncbi:MAG: FtsB family cell division protein [Acidimicrobiales bacterium]